MKAEKRIFSNYEEFPNTRQKSATEWILVKPFVSWEYDDYGIKRQVLIPIGLVTDYRSGCRIIDPLIPKMGKYSATWIVHDLCYAAELFKRSTCDWNMLLSLKEDGMWWIRRNIAWSTVKAFGGGVWDAHTQKSILEARVLINQTHRLLCDKNNPYQIWFNGQEYVNV